MANEFIVRKGLIVEGASGGTVVDIQGSQGQLFSVTDDLSGSIFAVSDISGVPIFDVNSSGVSYFDGNVGIGDTNPTIRLKVVDSTSGLLSAFTNSSSTGSGVQITAASGTANILQLRDYAGGEKLRVQGNGNVGIGTTAPDAQLEISNSNTTSGAGGATLRLTRADATSVAGDPVGTIEFYSTDGDGPKTTAYIKSMSEELYGRMGSLAFGTSVTANADAVEAMRIDYNGNVGIGTTSPGAKLHIGESGAAAQLWLQRTDGYNPVKLIGGTLADGNGFKITMNTSDAFAITSGGNVGIGTTAPGEKLVVAESLDNDLVILKIENKFGSTSVNGTGTALQFYGWDAGITANIKSIRTGSSYSPSALTFETFGGSGTTGTNTLSERMRIDEFGNVGIGTTAPSATLSVQGASSNGINIIGVGTTATRAFMGLNATNHAYLFVTGSSGQNPAVISSQGDSYISTNLGIGTTNPGTKLDVNGAITAGTANSTSGSVLMYGKYSNGHLATIGTEYSNGGLVLGYGVTPSTTAAGGFVSSSAATNLTRGAYSFAAGTHKWWSDPVNATIAVGTTSPLNNTMTLLDTGDLGIGTTAPVTKLDIRGGGANTLPATTGTTPSTGTRFRIANTSTASAALDFGISTGGKSWLQSTDRADLSVEYPFLINPNGGNVGIGTDSPVTKLHLYDNTVTVGLSIQADNASNSDINLGDEDDINIGRIQYSHSTDSMQFQINNAERIRITSTGNVGIGTDNPSYKLTVSSGTDDIGILTASSDSGSYVGFLDNATSTIPKIGAVGNKLILDASQYVGIKRTDPSYALDVSGTIRATGNVIAYSDARVKENVETIPNALDKVKAMRGVNYNKIGEEKREIGVIAQEVLEVLPEVVHQDEQGMYSVAYGNIVGVLVEAIKELTKEVEDLKKQLK